MNQVFWALFSSRDFALSSFCIKNIGQGKCVVQSTKGNVSLNSRNMTQIQLIQDDLPIVVFFFQNFISWSASLSHTVIYTFLSIAVNLFEKTYLRTYCSGASRVVEFLRDRFLHCWSRCQCVHLGVINYLNIDVLVGTEDTQSWSFRCPFNLKVKRCVVDLI